MLCPAVGPPGWCRRCRGVRERASLWLQSVARRRWRMRLLPARRL